MFSILIYDKDKDYWVIARDSFGIKPLYIFDNSKKTIISSEPAAIAKISKSSLSENSIKEWKMIRRPIPGKSYFENIDEILPGSIIDSNNQESFFWQWNQKMIVLIKIYSMK